VKCRSCLCSSDSLEQFLSLNLEIENHHSIDDAQLNFTSVELLDEEICLSCFYCKNLTTRLKQLRFEKLPKVLSIQLKRFKSSGTFTSKINRYAMHELKGKHQAGEEANCIFLYLTCNFDACIASIRFYPVQEGDWKYRLYAVLVHSGHSTTSGHYYCYVETSPGIWHCMNDTHVWFSFCSLIHTLAKNSEIT
jgi:ubiquitin carboxyl-terminal hydrolase 36/42